MPGSTLAHGSFEELKTYQAAREFRKKMYRAAKSLPEIEKYNVNTQIRRAALSTTINIAEGHGRFHYLDTIRFGLMSRGSIEELMADLNLCEDEGYLPSNEVALLKDQAKVLLRLLNGYLRHLKEQKTGQGLALREMALSYSAGDDDFSFLEDELAALDRLLITDHLSPITSSPHATR